jgi:phage baseplate assembly protein W
MAIKIAKLEQVSEKFKTDEFLYKDLHLDFKKSNHIIKQTNTIVEKNDIEVDYDKNAIKNSLRNLFNTRPGQRFLFPYYGLDLYQFVFEPITESNAQLIGEKIVRTIESFEQRVVVRQCNIKAKPEDNEYDITLVVEFPVFNTVVSLNSTLDIRTQSFIFAQTSRNK